MKKREDKNKKSGGESVVNAESVGFTVALFGVLLLLISCTGRFVFGAVGTAACEFLFGVFGLADYFVLAGVVLLGVRLILGKSVVVVKRFVVYVFLFLFFLFLTIHAFAVPLKGFSYGGYIAHCYELGAGWVGGSTPLGALGGVLWFPLHLATGYGAYAILILLSLLFAALAVFTLLNHYGIRLFNRSEEKKEPAKKEEEKSVDALSFSEMNYEEGELPITPWKTTAEKPVSSVKQRLIEPISPIQPTTEVPDYSDFVLNRGAAPWGEPKIPNADDHEGNVNFLYSERSSDDYRTQNLIFDKNSRYNTRVRTSVKVENKEPIVSEPKGAEEEKRNVYSELAARKAEELRRSAIAEEKQVISQEPTEERRFSSYNPDVYAPRTDSGVKEEKPSVDIARTEEEPVVYYEPQIKKTEEPDEREENAFRATEERDRVIGGEDSSVREEDSFDDLEDSREEREEVEERTRYSREGGDDYSERTSVSDRRGEFQEMFSDKENLFDDDAETEEEPEISKEREPIFDRTGAQSAREPVLPENKEEEKTEQKKPRIIKDYVCPPLSLLKTYNDNVSSFVSAEEIEEKKNAIVDTLSGFNLDVEVKNVTSGPVFTRFDIVLPRSVDVNKITRYRQEIAMNVHSENVNIYANFERGAVSIEVPNRSRATIGMKSLLLSDSYQNARNGALMFTVGKDADGKSVCLDLCKMPHMLVAGTTGSGKSVFLHSLIVSLIMRYSPEELRMIIIDPKWTEFSVYENLPHLMINEVLQDVKKVVVALNWAIAEMERRFRLFGQMTRKGIVVRSVDEYNEKVVNREDKLPKLVIIADEVYDLMVQAQSDIESRIARIAAKARAAGIHLVLATQRPSKEVITGVLKANLPARFALKVDSDLNSRIILDANGAEKLVGKGDLLFRAGSMGEPKRVQGAWIDSGEIQDVCNFIRENNEAYYDEAVNAYIESEGKNSLSGESAGGGDERENDVEPVYIEALRFIIKSKSASISMVQRKCSVGFNKAGKIIEWMERNGYISPYDGNGMKPRNVLITEEEFREKFGEL